MRNKASTLLPVAMLLSVFALPGSATLAGTSVSGSLTFGGDPSNYFDPGYGFVPSTGYLNASGATVTVSDGDVEFGFDDGSSLISADFSGAQLSISDLAETVVGPNGSFQMTFTDDAFVGNQFISASDSFPLTYSLAGNLLTLNYAGGTVTSGQTLNAVLNFSPTPEPSTAGLIFTSLLAAVAIVAGRNRRLKAQNSTL